MASSNSDGYGGGTSTGSTSDLALGDTSTAEGLVSTARGGRDEFDFGDDRAITNPPNWDALESQALYNSAVDNNDPGTADAMGQTWTNHGSELQRVADELYEAITELGGAWVGQAAGAAQGSLVGIANSSQVAGDAARTMGQRMSDQAAAAAEVKKLPPPSDFDFERDLQLAVLQGTPAAIDDFYAKWDEHNRVVKQQQAYLRAYTGSMTQVDGATPSFGPESLGLKPMAGHRSITRGVSGVLPGAGVGDGGPGLSEVRGRAGEVASSVHAQVTQHGGAAAHAGHAAAGTVDALKGQATAAGPLTGTGHAAVSTATSGPSAAGLGAAALGAGVGLAGARAISKSSRTSKQQQAAAAAEAEAAAAAAEEAEAEAEASAATEQAAAAHQSVAAQQAAATAAAAEALSSTAPSADPGTGAAMAESAQGAVSAAQQPVAAPAQQLGGVPGGPGGAPGGAPGGMGAMPPMGPMAPMGSGGAGAAAAGGGEAGGAAAAEDHAPAKFLIDPDPDDMFGADEAVTPTVIGAFDDDDE